MVRLYIVVPCYNEQEIILDTNRKLNECLSNLVENGLVSEDSRILYVNDGSKDFTWESIVSLHKEYLLVEGINLSANRGHENALMAGLMFAKDKADCVISMDADLQDDIGVIKEMLQKHKAGADVVYGVRKSRGTDTGFKRITAGMFYSVMRLLGANIVPDHANYRLMSKRSLEALSEHQEVNLFLRGIVPELGYNTDIVYYDRLLRQGGKSKYPLKKMIVYALEGITSFSIKPIRLIAAMGFLISVMSLVAIVYCVATKLFGYTVDGWTSLLVSLWFIGGVQLLGIGVIGEYVGKIYSETKHRPRYFIKDTLEQ